MNKLNTIAFDLDAICGDFENTTQLIDLMRRAYMSAEEQPQPQDFEALFAIYQQQGELCRKFRACVEDMCGSIGKITA